MAPGHRWVHTVDEVANEMVAADGIPTERDVAGSLQQDEVGRRSLVGIG